MEAAPAGGGLRPAGPLAGEGAGGQGLNQRIEADVLSRASTSSSPSPGEIGVPLPSLQRLSRKGSRRLGTPLQRLRRNTLKVQANPHQP